MATIKSFTDLEQSKKLAEILPIESADMWWSRCTITDFGDGVLKVSYAVEPCNISQFRNTKEDIPCWSLAALLKLIPNFNMFKRTIECRIETTNHLVDKACEPIDIAFEMICWLKEHNKI